MLARTVGHAALLFLLGGRTAAAQHLHSVRLLHPSPEVFRFEPAEVTARPGDRLEFTVDSGGPYVIGFEPADLAPRERALMNAAIPTPSAALRSPVLPRPGSSFELTVPALPKGRYRFAAVTHIAYRVSGVLVVP